MTSLALGSCVAAAALLACLGCSTSKASSAHVTQDGTRILDLTHSFDPDTIVWPTEESFNLIRQHAEDMPGGYFYASNRMELPEHGGTHVDAPIHFSRGKQTLDLIPVEQLIGAAVRIDVTAGCVGSRDYRVTVQDFERWEAVNGRIPDKTIVLIQTGYGRFWPSRMEYLGTELRGEAGVQALHFPGLHPAAAAWLVRERRVKAVGIDTASIDYGQSTTFDTHVELLSHNVPVFENLADLSQLPGRGFDIIALPMKIAGGSGGPLRIVAVLPQ